MKRMISTIALALAMSTLSAFAQNAGGPPQGGGEPGKGQGGFHLLPPRAMEQLSLTADQLKQVADLETEVKAKLEKILTAEQQQKLKEMRPPQRQGGPAGGGAKGGGEGQPSQPTAPAKP